MIMASGPITSWQIDGETTETVTEFILGGSKNHCRWWLQLMTAAMILKNNCSLEKSYDQLRQHIKKQIHYFVNKGPSSQSYGFSSSHAWIWEVDYKEIWALKNWCFWLVVLEKTLESPLDCKKIQPVRPKGNQSWIFIGKADVEGEIPILWLHEVKNWLIEKTLVLERLKAGGEWDDRGWDGWMVSVTQLPYVWVSSGSWWWTGKPGVLQSMGSQRVGHN